MAKFRIYWDNKWDNGTIITSTEQEDYEGENTQHIWPTRSWRSDSQVTEQISADLGQSEDIEVIIIENHNIPAGTDLEITGSDDPAGGAPNVVINPTITDDRIVYEFGAAETYRYWFIDLDNPAFVSGDYFEIGRIFMGGYLELAHHFANYKITLIDPSERIQSDAGQIASNRQDAYRLYSFDWSSGAVTQTELDNLYTAFQTIGSTVPFWINFNTDKDLPDAVRYVYSQKNWDFDPLTFERWGFSLDVEEAR